MRACFVMLMLILCASVWSQEPGADAKALNGKWKVASAEINGKPLPKEATQAWLLTLTDAKYAFTDGKTPDHGTVKIGATKKPKTMDITGAEGPNKDKTFLCIYEVQGDTLRVCYDLTGKVRPTEFATKKGAAISLVTYQRAK